MLHILLRDQPSSVSLVNFIMMLFHMFLPRGGGGGGGEGVERTWVQSTRKLTVPHGQLTQR